MDLLQYVLDASEAYEAGTLHVAIRLNEVLQKLSLLPLLPIAGKPKMPFHTANQNFKSDLQILRPFVPEMPAIERLTLWTVGPMKVGIGDDFESKCRYLEMQGCSRDEIVDTFNGIVNEWRITLAGLRQHFGPVLNDLEQRIVDSLADRQLTGEEIASQINEDYNGHFKGTLSGLMKRGVLDNARPRGYFNPAKRQSSKSGESQD